MPSTLFDSAGLAIVAYAQVNADGSSENTTNKANSGIYTTRLAQGQYLVQMSTALGQDPSQDLIFVQPTNTTYAGLGTTPIPASLVEDSDDFNKIVVFTDGGYGTTAIDCNFNVLVLRTVIGSPNT